MRVRAATILAFCSSALLALPVAAQTTGTIAGRVVDAVTEAPVADAVVIATSPSAQGEQTAVSDASGEFEITLLPPGRYTLTVQREGYRPFTEGGLTLHLDRTIKVRLTIAPDRLQAEAVEVTVARRPSLAVTGATTGGVITGDQLQLVPYGRTTRNFDEALVSIAGTRTDQYGTQINGSTSPESNWIIDGVNVTNLRNGTEGTRLLQDFVQEVELKTGGFQAEYGRSTGGVVNVITKSGGNELHGSIFGYWSPYEAPRRQVDSAIDVISAQTAQRMNLDFGVELGGPILRDRLWFYVGVAPQIVSTRVDRILNALVDDGSGQPALGPDGNALHQELGRKSYVQDQTGLHYTGKLTLALGEDHRIALAAYGDPARTSGPIGSLGGNEASMLGQSTRSSLDAALRYSGKFLHKTLLVEATLGVHKNTSTCCDFLATGASPARIADTPLVIWDQSQSLLAPQFRQDPTVPAYQSSPAVLAGCAIRADGFDPCPVWGYSTGGWGQTSVNADQRLSAELKLTGFVEAAGHHQLKLGGDAARDTAERTRGWTGGSAWKAQSISSSGQLVNSTAVNQYRLAGGYGHEDPKNPGQPALDPSRPGHLLDDTVTTRTQNVTLAAYAQDTWAILDKVVLDAGVRAESQLMYGDVSSLDTNGNAFDGPQLRLTNVMPRLGLVWDFTQRGLSKVYVSGGRFYEYVPMFMALNDFSSVPWFSVARNAQLCDDPRDPRTCAVVVPSARGARTWTFGGVTSQAPEAVAPDLQGQHIDEALAGVQWQVLPDVTFGLDFAHRQIGGVIEDLSVDGGNTWFIANPGVPGTLGYGGQTGSGVTVTYPLPRRVYDGLTLSVNKAFSHGWLLAASWTWSSLRGNYPGLFRAETGQLQPNVLSDFDLAKLLPNRDGPLEGDAPNVFKVSAARAFEVSSTVTLNLGGFWWLNQGTPLSYLGVEPAYGGSEVYLLPRGSAGRLPWTWQLDLRATAQVKLGGPFTLSLTLDLINATNNREVTSVDENYTWDAVAPIVNGSVQDLAFLKNSAGLKATPNGNFLKANDYQQPLTARLGARLSF